MDFNVAQRVKNISQTAKLACLIFIVAKILVFTVGYIAIYKNTGAFPASITDVFNHWDAPHYVDIAKNWYESNPTLDAYNFIVFFPLYPILIRLCTIGLNYINYSALIVSNICSTIVCLYIYKLAKHEFNKNVAIKAVLFLSIFPTAYFFSAPYTESLFFALTIASFYYARQSKWKLAGTLGLFASLTRLAGLLLLPVLLVEYYHQKEWKPKKTDLNIAWIFLALAGFLTYLVIDNQVTGDPFTFMSIEATHWFNRLDPIAGLTNAYNCITSYSYPDIITCGIAPIAFAVFGLLMISLIIWKRAPPSYITYMFLSWALAVSTSWWISVPRYIMAMFPMFILLGALTNNKKVATITIIIISGALLCYFTAIFAIGWWAF
ncbi:MAG: glycosyltransferase family 39 protein [Candidatus Bathyarchaeota archaeon]|uniref:glycosyltransferase family 39 protein n=1 Tax=Candidatus Bathycorpusculum sp. TaxID=2994959 RepID=UPI002831CDFB|nr:glycosyltransferase family 39 protein [Candidatus Termiticorpusculum sp.]MCL2257665.1 glycosyltransferase family 39 protein [Candidatus Termiticorpusculum sp.]MCL2291976.1 glycosyltransferase family 39 protein [Candidatus Termiticorpusculum sp.]